MAQTFEGGGDKSPHSSLWKEMPSSGEGGQRIQYGGRPEPRASLPAHPPQGCAAPPPQPLAPSPPGSSLGA